MDCEPFPDQYLSMEKVWKLKSIKITIIGLCFIIIFCFVDLFNDYQQQLLWKNAWIILTNEFLFGSQLVILGDASEAKNNGFKLNRSENIFKNDNNGGMKIERAIVNSLFWSSSLQTAAWQ